MLELTEAQIETIRSDEDFIETCCEFASAWQFQENGGEFGSDSDEECATDFIIWCEINQLMKSMGFNDGAPSIDVHMHTYNVDLLILEIEIDPDNTPHKKQFIRVEIEDPYPGWEWVS